MPEGLNRCTFIGNLGDDPSMRYTANGSAVTNFRMAVSRSYAGDDGQRKEDTEWVSIVTWNKLAEICGANLNKGRKVYVEGRLSTRMWEKDGQKHYRTEIVANQVLFLDSAKRENNDAWPPADFISPDLDPGDLPFDS